MTLNVCMITYNHEKYIQQAIDSILMQKTNFEFNIIIGEDFSTDLTRNICTDYAERYPNKIVLITSAANVGMQANFLRTYKSCTANYIAFCEGDDYWTDPYKLQKQVDFLREHEDYSGCFHNVMIKTERGGIQSENIMHTSLLKDSFSTVDVLGPWFIASPSFVFVNYPDFELPEWFHNCKYGDLPFMLLLSLRGKFKYLDEVMGVYRLHDNGMSTYHKAYDKIMLMVYIYACFDIHTSYQFHETIRKSVQYEVDRHAIREPVIAPPAGNPLKMILKNQYLKVRQFLNRLTQPS